MSRKPFELERYLEEMNEQIQSLADPYKISKAVNSPAIRIASNTAADFARFTNFDRFESLAKPPALQRAFKFDTPEFKRMLSGILDVDPGFPQFKVAAQFKTAFYDDEDNLTDTFDEFAETIHISSPKDLWIKSDGDSAELSPQILEAVRIVTEDINKRTPLETAGIISSIIGSIGTILFGAFSVVTWFIS